jgi:EAL domain-containing protein (putative c-di-GMP-specific phosphodiesterase class I)
VLQALTQEPDLARRLVVEVGCATATLQDAEAIRDFCRALADRGCFIALDHFGSGAASLALLQSCKPDILKLGDAYVRRATETPFGFESLQNVLSLGAQPARWTVLEGVDHEQHLGVALKAGARWMQGYYLGGPQMASLDAT